MIRLVCVIAVAGTALAVPAFAYLGRVDTVGGTTYDWQMNGGAERRLVNSPLFGLHAAWVYSADTSGQYPDRNLRYNFYDNRAGAWNWTDPDFMQSGVNVFTTRSGLGNLDACSATGCALFCSYAVANPIRPFLARDISPGGGIFEGSDGPDGYLWPVLAIGQESVAHVVMVDDSTREGAWYSRVRSWPTWETPEELTQPGTSTLALASARTGLGVCFAWTVGGGNHYLVSTDGGDNWLGMDSLPVPPAFGGDTVPVFSDYGLFPFFDSQGRLHFAATIVPKVQDTVYNQPAEIWHWCAQNAPNWARVHRAGCRPENMQGGIGYNAAYAGRPSLGEDEHGMLGVAWEQFDSSNVEPLTGLLRAGVWVGGSEDNGASWAASTMLTDRNTVSHRFPCIGRVLPGSMDYDSAIVLYEMDQVAGFASYGQGSYTFNPVVCQFARLQYYGVSDKGAAGRESARGLRPTVVRSLPDGAVVFDAMGRRVVSAKPGVYFVREEPQASSHKPQDIRKVVVQR
jgi:hypothetical protein